MKIAAWNVNSIGARLGHVLQWLREAAPNVLLLQELKCREEMFPYAELANLGYQAAVLGQKSYNGVAILAKGQEINDVCYHLPFQKTETEPQARYIEATVAGVRVASVYVPNGNEPNSEKFHYKMAFYQSLQQYLREDVFLREQPYLLGGDFNVAHQEIDAYDPQRAAGKILFLPEERAAFRTLLHQGFVDTLRVIQPQQQLFSWWDYREGRLQRNEGFRIDYILASPQAADTLIDAGIDAQPRNWDKPSDHTPVWCVLKPSG